MCKARTHRSHTTYSHLRSGKIQGVAEAQVRVVVHQARAARAVLLARVTLVAAAMQADKVNRVAAIVLPGLTTRQAVLSQTR